MRSAEGYGGGSSEERVRDVLDRRAAARPDGAAPPIAVCTKFLPTAWRFTRGAVVQATRDMLARLGGHPIALLLIHSPVHPVPIETWMHGACDAAELGLVQDVGVSNCDAAQVRRAAAVARARGRALAANQIHFSLLSYNSAALRETKRACDELGVRIMAYGTLGQGLLADGLTRERVGAIRMTRMARTSYDELAPLRARVHASAQAHGVSMAAVCINWAVSRGAVPLVGCKSAQHVHSAASALGWSLGEAELKELDALALDRSTLDKPVWKRGIFVVLLSLLVSAYKLERWLRPPALPWRERAAAEQSRGALHAGDGASGPRKPKAA